MYVCIYGFDWRFLYEYICCKGIEVLGTVEEKEELGFSVEIVGNQ